MIVITKRIVDKKAIKAARKEFSEVSGLPAYGEPHHIIPKSVGGPDHRFNLIQLSWIEHYEKVANGKLKADQLFATVAKREGMTTEEVKTEVNHMRGRAG